MTDAPSETFGRVVELLVVELPLGDSTERIGLIGSCRLHDPWKAAIADGVGRIVWSAGNAFTHTLSEAAQHLAHCRGELSIDTRWGPFVFKSETVPASEERLIQLSNTCDVVYVEVSSLSGYRLGATCLNVDYFSHGFLKGRGLPALNWFRTVGPEGGDQTLAEALIKATPPEDVELVEAVVSGLRRYIETPEDQAAALKAVAANTRVTLCPIFRHADLAPHILETREQLASVLKQLAASGHKYCDISPLIERVGPKIALDANGADYFHFAPSFLRQAGAAYLDHAKTPAPPSRPDAKDALAEMRGALKVNDLAHAAAVAQTLLELAPDHAEAWFVLGRAALIAGDSCSARRAFQKAVEFEPNSDWYALNLARATERTGDASAALALYRRVARWVGGRDVYAHEAAAAVNRLGQ